MQTKEHWETVYTTKVTTAASWFQEHADNSLMINTAVRCSTQCGYYRQLPKNFWLMPFINSN